MKLNAFFISAMLFSGILACSRPESDNNDGKPSVRIPEKAFVLAEQSVPSVVIMNAGTNAEVWSWDPVTAGLSEEHQAWFVNPSEVKPVYNGKYVLMTASGGAVALIRIADSRLVFYGKCGTFPNPHSAEILPDGNIVAVESRYGKVCIFVTGTDELPVEPVELDLTVEDAHNAVWSRKHDCLFMTGRKPDTKKVALYRFEYNGDRMNPALVNQKEVWSSTVESGGHDLFPVYGEEDRLWMTAANGVYKFDVTDPDAPVCEKISGRLSIKSISNGPDGIVMLKPTESWWAEGLIDDKGEPLFIMPGKKFYKGRWFLDNTFSYPEVHDSPYR